jgi:hypothetical protein
MIDLLQASFGENTLTVAFFGRLFHLPDRRPLSIVLKALFGVEDAETSAVDAAFMTYPHWKILKDLGLLKGDDGGKLHERFRGGRDFDEIQSELVHTMINNELDAVLTVGGKMLVVEAKRGRSRAGRIEASTMKQVARQVLCLRLCRHYLERIGKNLDLGFAIVGAGGDDSVVEVRPSDLQVRDLSNSPFWRRKEMADRPLSSCLPDLPLRESRQTWFGPEKAVACSWSHLTSLVSGSDGYLARIHEIVCREKSKDKSGAGI